MAEPWQEVDGALYKKFEFANFADAFAFMTKVAQLAEEQDHHPDWSNSWNVVEISLCSHDKGRVGACFILLSFSSGLGVYGLAVYLQAFSR